jgi:putative peptidoglycan lipid II flippase
MLNSLGRFGVPALAPAWLNLGMIVFGIALMPVCRRFGQPTILAMAIGVLIGGVLQFASQLPTLHRVGFRFGLRRPFGHPGVARVASLMLPATIGLAATQFNLVFSTILASLLPQGSVSWLWYAFRIMQLPIGVFGVALATVSLPALSRAAVAADMAALKTTLSATLRLVFLVTIPSALWLAVMSRPLIRLLYQHGRFHEIDTTRTGDALVMYCIGLPAFAAVGVMTRTFYALGDTRRPVQASFVSVALNVILNLLLMRPLGHLGLALSTSATAFSNLFQLSWYLRRRIGPFGGRRMASSFGRVLGAAAIMAAVSALSFLIFKETWKRSALLDALMIAVSLLGGLLVSYAAMKVLRVEELAVVDDLFRSARARLFGRRAE